MSQVVEKGIEASQVDMDLGINARMLRRWVREYGTSGEEAFPGNGRLNSGEAELRRMQKEYARLKAENEILKKAAAYFDKNK